MANGMFCIPGYPMCLIDGCDRPEKYHAASQIGCVKAYDRRIFKYIGDGVVYSVAGVLQKSSIRLSFFILRENRPQWAK